MEGLQHITLGGLAVVFLTASVGSSSPPFAGDDRRSEAEVLARFEAFDKAWQRRDMDFIRDFYAHDDDMLLFFERRQLLGWPRVEKLYQNMFQHASGGEVVSKTSNVEVKARDELAYVAANFHLQVTDPSGRTMTDEGRETVVFEKRDGRWVVVHRHTSFQAPSGPQRHVPFHTEPGPLWSPTLEGAWKSETEGFLIATASHLATSRVPELPASARYRLTGSTLFLEPLGGDEQIRLEGVAITPNRLSFQLDPSRKWSWERVE
jgi:uncharacterized protein (TIGR02246 family)